MGTGTLRPARRLALARDFRPRVPCRLALALALACLVAAGCGPGTKELADRYEAEKMAWRAGKLAAAMRENPDLATDEMRSRVEGAYEAIVKRFRPPASEAALTSVGRDVASIAAQSRLALAGLAARRGDFERALSLAASVRDSFSFDQSASIQAYLDGANALEALDRWPEAAALLGKLTEEWWPAPSSAEEPDPRILRTPLKIAAGYAARGEDLRASEWYAKADAYYDDWISRWDGSPTAVLSLQLKGEAYAQQGRFLDAAAAYERLVREHGTAENQAGLWLRLGELYTSLGRRAKARDYYLMVTKACAGETPGATAEIAIARLNIEDGQYPAARVRLEQVLGSFANDRAIAATALYYRGLSYELEGQWERALPDYVRLTQEYPTSLDGLMAPLRVARHYREAGAEEAARAAYARAVEQYERVISEHASTPAETAARSYLVDALSDQGEWERAADTLVETAERSRDSEAAPGLLLQAADIYEARMNDAAKAEEILRKIVEDYPGTEASRAAAARLDTPEERP